MNITPFALERYFARHEFSARHLLSSSDCEALSLSELLAMADDETETLWKELKFGYTESEGHPLLRGAIAGGYDGLGAADIRVVVPEEGIFLLMHALLEPGDHVVCIFPGYQSLYDVARSIGCDVSQWVPDEAHGWRFDIRQLEDMLRDNTRLVVVNFPHNPTGCVPTKETFAAIAELARQRSAYLLSDEMYRHLETDSRTTLPAACEMYDRAVSLSGLSKSYGLPGLRIGWLACRDRQMLDRVSALKDYTTICNSAPSEILAIMALRNRSAIIGQQRLRLQRNITVLESFFDTYDNCFQWNRPAGGSICFPRCLLPDDTFEFCETLVREAGIMLVPSRMFQFGDRHVRIGFGRQDFPEVLSLFSRYLDEHFR